MSTKEVKAAIKEIGDPDVFECMYRDSEELILRDPIEVQALLKHGMIGTNFEVIRFNFFSGANYPKVASAKVKNFTMAFLKEVYPNKWKRVFENTQEHLRSLLLKGNFKKVETYAARFLEDHVNFFVFWETLASLYGELDLEETIDHIFRIFDLIEKSNFGDFDISSFMSSFVYDDVFSDEKARELFIEKMKLNNRHELMNYVIAYSTSRNKSLKIKKHMRFYIDLMIEKKEHKELKEFLRNLGQINSDEFYHDVDDKIAKLELENIKYYADEILVVYRYLLENNDDEIKSIPIRHMILGKIFNFNEYINFITNGKRIDELDSRDWYLILDALDYVKSYQYRDINIEFIIEYLKNPGKVARFTNFFDHISKYSNDPNILKLSAKLKEHGYESFKIEEDHLHKSQYTIRLYSKRLDNFCLGHLMKLIK